MCDFFIESFPYPSIYFLSTPKILRIHMACVMCLQIGLKVSELFTSKICTDLFGNFLQFKLQSVFLVYLGKMKFKSFIQRQGQVWKLKIKTFHLAPRLMGLHALFMEI